MADGSVRFIRDSYGFSESTPPVDVDLLGFDVGDQSDWFTL
jgi:hypothetical protein